MSFCKCGESKGKAFTFRYSIFLLSSMPFNEDDILQVCEITGCDVQQAEQYMEIANGDVNVAISLLLDNGPSLPRAVPDVMDIEEVSSDDTSEPETERIHRVYDSQGVCRSFP